MYPYKPVLAKQFIKFFYKARHNNLFAVFQINLGIAAFAISF